MRHQSLALTLLLLSGALSCGDKKEKPGDDKAPEPAPAAKDDAAAAVTGDAAASPSATKVSKARPEKPESYSRALSQGQKLEKKADYDGAIAAFQQALAAVPDDARALSELGWAAFQNGDLDLAAEATEKSIANAIDPKLKAASLYNRGRIAEQRGDQERAEQAYTQSLELRPNKIVQKRLIELGAAARGELLAPVPLEGPFASPKEYCARLRVEAEEHGRCDTARLGGPVFLDPTEPPYVKVVIFAQDIDLYDAHDDYDVCRIGIQTAEGWYVTDEPFSCENWKWGKSMMTELSLTGDDARGTPVLRVAVRGAVGDRGTRDGERYMEWLKSERLRFCGVGPSARPSCTPWIWVATAETEYYEDTGGEDYQATARLLDGGVMELSSESKPEEIPRDVRALLGKHKLEFP